MSCITLKKETNVIKFQPKRRKSENEKEIELLSPKLKKIIQIQQYSKKIKQFQNFE
jgi:hypothetical protein